MADNLKITTQHALALTQDELATLDAILATIACLASQVPESAA